MSDCFVALECRHGDVHSFPRLSIVLESRTSSFLVVPGGLDIRGSLKAGLGRTSPESVEERAWDKDCS